MTQGINIKICTKIKMIKTIQALIAIDILIIALCLVSGNFVWLINTQVGFITSALVVFGSFMGYKRMINARIDAGDLPYQRDLIDKIEDPYELDDDRDDTRDFKEIVKEEKEKQKRNKRPLMQVIKDSRASLSIYRLSSYFLLFVGFMVLNNKEYFHAQSYLVGIFLAPLVIIGATYFFADKED